MIVWFHESTIAGARLEECTGMDGWQAALCEGGAQGFARVFVAKAGWQSCLEGKNVLFADSGRRGRGESRERDRETGWRASWDDRL